MEGRRVPDMELTQTDWQERFDTDFPHGLIAEIDNGDPYTDPTYTCPRVVVVGMNGSMPMVVLPVVASSKSFTLSVVTYTTEGTDPVVASVIDAEGTRWHWSSGVSEEMAAVLTPLRDDPVNSPDFLAGEPS